MTLTDLETNNAHFLEYDQKPFHVHLVSNILSPYTVCTTMVITLVTYFPDMYDSDKGRILITGSINGKPIINRQARNAG
jgi:short-subunit dehydrogenase